MAAVPAPRFLILATPAARVFLFYACGVAAGTRAPWATIRPLSLRDYSLLPVLLAGISVSPFDQVI
jgi:hypothetical protein